MSSIGHQWRWPLHYCEGWHHAVGRIFGVKGQRVATTQHQVDTLTNRNRLEEFDNVCVSVSQDANFINIDNDITCKEKREIDNVR